VRVLRPARHTDLHRGHDLRRISIHRQNNEPDRFSSSSKPLAIIGIVLGALTLVLSIVAALAGFGLQLIEQANRL